jgi:hypothetical protein
MTLPDTIGGILVKLDIADEQALFIMLASDGTANRMGTGAVGNAEKELFIGRTSPELFQRLRRQVGADLLQWVGGFAHPSPQGELCRLTVGFMYEDGREAISRWQYGTESQGPPRAVADFVVAAVQITEPWFQEQKQMAGSHERERGGQGGWMGGGITG